MTIQDRLQAYLNANRLTAKQFENIVGLGNGTCSSISDHTRQRTFDRISNAFPNLNIDWLRYGEGEMLAEGSPPSNASEPPSQQAQLMEQVHTMNNLLVQAQDNLKLMLNVFNEQNGKLMDIIDKMTTPKQQ